MREKKISVVMAAYNGEKYIEDQINSIICQMQENDELIISIDPSTDNTLEIIQKYAEIDVRIKMFENNDHSKGLVSNFENALRHCNGDIIFYSDQDDVWKNDKLQKIYDRFNNSQISVVIHDAELVDEKLNVLEPSIFALRGGARNTVFGNLVRLSYIGCCMAFRASLLPAVLPIVTKGRSHDWWTGCICMCYGKMDIVNEKLILHRMHGNNATPSKRPPISYQLSVRWRILLGILQRKLKLSDRKDT